MNNSFNRNFLIISVWGQTLNDNPLNERNKFYCGYDMRRWKMQIKQSKFGGIRARWVDLEFMEIMEVLHNGWTFISKLNN